MKSILTAARAVALVLGVAGLNAHSAELSIGDKAPEFEAKDDAGKTVKSSDIVGKKVIVVYFYPADLTGGCTKQACGFRDDMKTLSGKEVVVLGVSGDSVENHKIFKKEHDLNFQLLADEDGAVAKAFGVPFTPGPAKAKVKAEGKEIELTRGGTAKRWTFLIDKSGKVVMKNTEVKAADDSKAILKAIEELK